MVKGVQGVWWFGDVISAQATHNMTSLHHHDIIYMCMVSQWLSIWSAKVVNDLHLHLLFYFRILESNYWIFLLPQKLIHRMCIFKSLPSEFGRLIIRLMKKYFSVFLFNLDLDSTSKNFEDKLSDKHPTKRIKNLLHFIYIFSQDKIHWVQVNSTFLTCPKILWRQQWVYLFI